TGHGRGLRAQFGVTGRRGRGGGRQPPRSGHGARGRRRSHHRRAHRRQPARDPGAACRPWDRQHRPDPSHPDPTALTRRPAMTAKDEVTPEKILELGFGFWASKTLLSAVELGLFTELAKGAADAETLRTRLRLHPRAARDFFDALVALGMLERQDGRYRNHAASGAFPDRGKASYGGGLLEMANARLYGFWGSLTEALKSGQPQNEAKSGESFFHKLYQDPEKLKVFAKAMTAVSFGPALAIAAKFPWARYKTFA